MDFIYGLYDPREPRRHISIRYVGKATDVERRTRQHCQPFFLKRDAHTHKIRWVVQLLAAGVKPKAIILERCTEKESWKEAEECWVQKLEAKGCRLTNTGGTGQGGQRRGTIRPEWVRQKISRGMAGVRNCLGRKLSTAHRSNISEGLKRSYVCNPRNVLTDEVIQGVRKDLASGTSVRVVRERYRIHKRRVRAIRDGLLTEENKNEFRSTE